MKELTFDDNYKIYTELINRLEDVKDALKKQNYGIAMDILCKPYPAFQITTSAAFKDGKNYITIKEWSKEDEYSNWFTQFDNIDTGEDFDVADNNEGDDGNTEGGGGDEEQKKRNKYGKNNYF